MTDIPSAPEPRSSSVPRILLSCTGISAASALFFLFFPFGAAFSWIWSLVVALSGLALLYPKACFAAAGFFILLGLCTEEELSSLKPRPKLWIGASRFAARVGGAGIAFILLTTLLANAWGPGNPSEVSGAVEMAEKRLESHFSQKTQEEREEFLSSLVLGVTLFTGSKDTWKAQLDGPYVVLTRPKNPVPACRKIVGKLEGYQVKVNGRPASPDACNKGWDNVISVSLPIPE